MIKIIKTAVHTEFYKFTKLQDILVELVVVDHWEDCLVESLQLLHVVTRHISKLYYATATSITNSKLTFINDNTIITKSISLWSIKFMDKPDMPRLENKTVV